MHLTKDQTTHKTVERTSRAADASQAQRGDAQGRRERGGGGRLVEGAEDRAITLRRALARQLRHGSGGERDSEQDVLRELRERHVVRAKGRQAQALQGQEGATARQWEWAAQAQALKSTEERRRDAIAC